MRYFYVKSQSIASTSNTTFWWGLQTQTEWVIFELARAHHLGIKALNFENPVFTFGCFALEAVYMIVACYKNPYKVTYIHSCFVFFNCSVFSALHAKHFEIWKHVLWNWWFDCFIGRSIKWCDISGVDSESIFPFVEFFFLEEAVFFGLLISCLSLS